tara:strand:+ start:4676 stop:13792 length:9117 start_codon:yes stop_codon:yes gene_type:complete
MFRIKWEGNFYNVPEEELSDYPGYELAPATNDNVGKLNGPVQETAIAGSESTSSTGSTSDPGSLELEKINNIRKKFGNEDENVISELNEEDEKKLRNHIATTSGSDFNYDEIAKKIAADPEKYASLLTATQNPSELLNRNKLLQELMPGFSEVSNPYLEKIAGKASTIDFSDIKKGFDLVTNPIATLSAGKPEFSDTKYNFGDDDAELYSEPYSRVKFGGNSILHKVAGMSVGALSDPYIFSEENLNEVGDGNRFVVTYDNEGSGVRNEKYKTKSFNINTLRAIYDNLSTDKQNSEDLVKFGDQNKFNKHVEQDVYNKRLSSNEKIFTDLRKNYEGASPEKRKELENNPIFQAYMDNAPEKLYEVSGPNKGNVVSLDDASADAREIQERSTEILETTEVDMMNTGLSKAYSNLKAAAKAAHTDILRIGETNFKNQTFKYPGQKYMSNILDFVGDDTNFNADLRNLKSIFENDELPENLTTIAGTTPNANKYNNALKEYLAFGKAVAMNIDPIKSDRDTFFGGIVDNLGRTLGLNEKLESKQEAVRFFDAAINKNTSLKYVDQKQADERLYEGFGDARYIGDGFMDLAKFAAEIYALRKVSGNAISKGINKADKALKGGVLYSNPVTRGATKFTLGAVDEAALFVSLSLLKDENREQIQQSALFGGALGGGNKIGGAIVGRLMDPKSKFFMPATHKMIHYNMNPTNVIAGSASGSTVYHFAQLLTDSDEFMKLLEVDKNDPNYSNYFGQKLLQSWTAEFVKMTLLSGTKNIPMTNKGFNNLYHSMREDVLRMKGRDAKSEGAANYYSIDHNRIDKFTEGDKRYKQNTLEKDINKAYQNKLNEIESNQKNGKITEQEAKEQASEAITNKLILENKLALVTAKKTIESAQGKKGNEHYFVNEAEANGVGQKLLKGEELTEKESRKFSNVNPIYVLNSLGARGRKIAEGKDGMELMNLQQLKAQQIQELLNSGEFKVAFNDAKERQESYEHLSKMWSNSSKQNLLNFKSEKTDAEKEQLKQLKEEYKDLTEGETYKKIKKSLEDYTNKRYQEDIAFTKEILKVTGQAKGLKQAQSEKEFQKIYNGTGLKSQDVRGELAFYNPVTQKMVINKQRALQTRTITSGKHEVLHHVLRDVLKNEEGKVTTEGIKIIDDVLNELTPEQRKVVQDRIDDNYRYDEKGKEKAKEDYYEEYLTSLSEAISTGEIAFRENVGKSLLDFIPGMRKKGFENLEIGVETGQQLFNLIKSYSKNETLGIEAAKAISKDAPVKGLRGEGKASKDFKIELESDKKTGVAKLKAKIQENRDMGPGNQLMNRNIEQSFKEQIKRVEDLETQFSATELRAKIKKAKGENKEDLQLALEEKFRGFEKEVELAGLNIETGEAQFSKGGKAKELLVYNASPRSFNELGKRTGLIYLATNKREASAYAKMNRGKVKNIYINENKVASEQDLINTMKELKIDTSEGSLYELIDSRFDFYIGKEAMNKVTKALSEKGFLAARYQDGAQVVPGKVESIVVFDKSVISDKKGVLKQAVKVTSPISELAVKYKNNTLTVEETKKFRDQYIAAGKDALGRWAAKKGVPVNAIKNNAEVEGKLIDQFGSVTKNYKPENPVTGKKQEFTTYLDNILGRRIGTKLVEEYNKSLQKTSAEELKERGREITDIADQKQNIEDAIDVSFGNRSEVSQISNGTPSKIQRNLKVDGKRILSEEDGPVLREEFIDAAIRISEKLIKDLKLPPDSKDFRKQLSKEIAKETELFEEFKEKLDIGTDGKYEAFLNGIMSIIKDPKSFPLSFYTQAEKFSQRLGREPLFVVKEADANPKSKYLKKARGPGYNSENPGSQGYSRATKTKMMELAIKEGKASYTENLANGVTVYERLDTRKESPNKIKEFFKVQNTKAKLIKTLFNQAMIDAVIGQKKKKLYSVTEKEKIAQKAQKEHDVFFSKNGNEKAKGKREEGMGPKGFYKDGPAQNKAHTNLIKKAAKKDSGIDPAFLEIIVSKTNTAPTGGQVNKETPDVFEGKKRSSKDPKKITQKLLTGDYRVSREDLSGVAGSGYTLTLLEAGYLWNVEKLSNIVKEAFGKQEFTDAVKHGKSSQERGNTKIMEALSKKNFTKEELTKEVIDWYVENAIKLHKIDSRAAWDLLYNQNASGGINRQLSKVILHELGTKKVDTRLEHLLQNGSFNKLIQDMATMSEAGKNQVKEWIKKSYRQAAISETTRKIVDGTYVVEGREKRWEAAYELPPIIQDAINKIKKGEKNVEIPSIDARLFNRAYGNNTVNPYAIKTFDKNGKIISKAEEYGLGVPSGVWRNSVTVQKNAANIIADMVASKVTRAEGIKRFNKTLPISVEQSRVALKFSKGRTSDIVEVINQKENKSKEIKEKQTAKFSKQDISKQFNGFLEKSTGIKKESVFGAATAMARGKQAKTDFGDYFIPVGAEDFAGLMHKTLARGKQGEKQLEFYEKTLYDPYNKAVESMTNEAMALKNDFKAIKKQLSNVPKTLKEFTEGGVFTKEQAVRVYMWNKLGYEIPGISKKVKSELLKEVNKNADLHTFANEIIKITKGDGYAKPKESWVAGNIAMDMVELLNGTKRTKHLEVWQKNVDQIFSKENLFKLEAAYGAKYVKTLKATLDRMKSGSNRKWGANETVEKWNDWVNGSVGAIMFLNTRSAVLQTISNINYLNFKDNNPLQAAKAFANQKQYWTDFNTLFNSQYLQSRRGGNRININESELALAQQKGGVQGVIALMLNKGFVLTRMADSFAIATGGASMYRNRLNTYKKQGLSEKEAKEKAFTDFMKITEETQQSSRPDRISEQQASSLGRFMLAFANTPMQYNRIIKRNLQDLIAGRGDPREKITKITYYGMIQNIIFNSLQKALFISAFSDEEDDKQQERTVKVAEGMLDSLLRGSGLYGNAAVAVKNTAKAIATNKQDPELQALTISPPLYSKVSKLRSSFYTRKYITKQNMFEPSLDNPALNAGAQFSSAVFNFPLDRAIRKAQNIEAAVSDDANYMQRAALLLGWNDWELNMEQPEKPKRKRKKKVKRYSSASIKK